MNLGRTSRDIVRKAAVDEDTVRGDGERRGLHQPHVAVDTRALIEPALELRGIDTNRDDVLSPDVCDIGDVVTKAPVAALVATDEPSIHEHRAVAEDPVEL